MTPMKIAVDGTITEVKPKNGKKLTLEEMQAVVGGLIERVQTNVGDMYCNEEGLLQGLPYNSRATRLMREKWGYGDIVGDVLVLLRKGKTL